MNENVVRCDGIHCTAEATVKTKDATPTGWIAVSSVEEKGRFCSWECLVAFANERLKAVAGD